MDVNLGRFTASSSQDVVVFLIGMRFNKIHRVDHWWPIFQPMPTMLRHLAQDPESGLLGQHLWFGRTTILLSYWESVQHLHRFAADPDAPHRAAWSRAAKRLEENDGAGFWHETYVVPAGSRESIYDNMPAFGLGAATSVVPAGKGLQTAKQRLAANT